MPFFRHVRALPWRAVMLPSLFLVFIFWLQVSASIFEAIVKKSDFASPLAPLVIPAMKSCLFLGWAWLINGAIKVFVWDGLARHFGHEAIPRFFRHTVASFIFLCAFMGIFTYVFDQSMTGIWATSGALSLVLGFALKSLIADFFSGIALSLDPPFHLGDWITVRLPGEEPILGQVMEMHWRLTRLQDRDRTRIIAIPHSLLASVSVTNLYRPHGYVMLDLKLWLDQRHGIDRLIRILESALIGLPGILENPRAHVILADTNEAGIVFCIRFFTGSQISAEVARSRVLAAALARLEHAGVSTANVKRDAALGRLREPEAWSAHHGIEALVLRTSIFATLDPDEARELAKHAKLLEVRSGQHVIQAGEPGQSMYIVREGALEVLIPDAHGEHIRARHLNPGDFFGEMSLLTGDARSATVTASTGAVLYEIGKHALEPLLQKNPQIAEQICQIVATRRAENTGLLEGRAADSALDNSTWQFGQLLGRMKRFFGL